MAIENLIRMAEQVSRLGDQDLAALTQEEGIQAILAATEMKDRERVRSNVPITQGDQPTVIENLISRALGGNQQAPNPNMTDPNTMDSNMMANMPAEPPMMPQGMQSNVDPRMLAQQPPMARMGGLLRRFAPGGSLNTDYLEALGEDPNIISMAKYNQITSPEFQADQLGYNYETMGGVDFKGNVRGGASSNLQKAIMERDKYTKNPLNQNLPANVYDKRLTQFTQNISDAEKKDSEHVLDVEAEGELKSLFDQGLLLRNPQYYDLAEQAKNPDGSPDSSKLLELIKMAEGSKIDDDTQANLVLQRDSQTDVGAGAGDDDSGDGAAVAPVVASTSTPNNTNKATIEPYMFGQTKTRSDEGFETDLKFSVVRSLKDNTEGLGGIATDTKTTITDSDKLSRTIDAIDTKRLLDLQDQANKAEEALNKISETDFPSRDEIIGKNKQQIKLGMAQAFFNAAASGKPSFMEAMGESLGAASGVMQKGTAKEQKDLMQLAIADYNRAAKKFDIADKKRTTLSTKLAARAVARQTYEQKNRDITLDLAQEHNKFDLEIAKLNLSTIQEEQARKTKEKDLSLKANKQWVDSKKYMTNNEFKNTILTPDELDAVAAMDLGPVGLLYVSGAQAATKKSIDKFMLELPEEFERLKANKDNAGFSDDDLLEKARKNYREKLLGGEELGTKAVFDRFNPIIENMTKLKITNPDSHQANINRLKDEYPWLPTAYYE